MSKIYVSLTSIISLAMPVLPRLRSLLSLSQIQAGIVWISTVSLHFGTVLNSKPEMQHKEVTN